MGWLRGHLVEQFYAEMSPGRDSLEILFDLGYALPETRGDATAPQPERSWLLERSPAEMAELRSESEKYLRQCLSFSRPEGVLKTIYRFRDFETDPPDFPRPLTGGAYFRVLIQPAAPHLGAPVTCHLAGGERPKIVIKLPTPEPSYLTLKPGETLLMTGEAERCFAHYAWLTGFKHVLPMGLDHVLFIVGLFLFQRRFRPLLWQSLAFTAAHTLTLGLSAAGTIPQAGPWIEILIPLSIAAVALENLGKKVRVRGRIIVVFFFGLIHGLGFASALQKLFPSDDSFIPFLLLTNLGIECAQVLILAVAWLITLPLAGRPGYPKLRKVLNLALLAAALFWTIERTIGVL